MVICYGSPRKLTEELKKCWPRVRSRAHMQLWNAILLRSQKAGRKAGKLGQRIGNTAIDLDSGLYMVTMKCNFYICRHIACGPPVGLQSQQTSGWAGCGDRSKVQAWSPTHPAFSLCFATGSFASLGEWLYLSELQFPLFTYKMGQLLPSLQVKG